MSIDFANICKTMLLTAEAVLEQALEKVKAAKARCD